MNPATIIRDAARNGVILSLSASGRIKAIGKRESIDQWSLIIREHKTSLVAWMSEPVSENAEAEKITTPALTSVLSEAADVLSGAEIVDTSETENDRRFCTQCLNLRGRTCTVARLGGPVSARRGYEPVSDMLHRCAGYAPDTTDTDQRTGHERWPGLIENERVEP